MSEDQRQTLTADFSRSLAAAMETITVEQPVIETGGGAPAPDERNITWRFDAGVGSAWVCASA
jgi:hypothetical protein